MAGALNVRDAVLPSQAGQGQPIRLPGQTRVTPDEYREFLGLGHGEIFDLDIDRSVAGTLNVHRGRAFLQCGAWCEGADGNCRWPLLLASWLSLALTAYKCSKQPDPANPRE